jgi:hypothetical protein
VNPTQETTAATRKHNQGRLSQRQFGLRHLLAAMVLLSVGLAMIRYLRVYGVLVIWLVALLYTQDAVRSPQRRQRLLIADLLWGILMPVLCMVFDPGMLYVVVPEPSATPLHWAQPEMLLNGIELYLMIALQIGVLGTWLLLGSTLGRTSAAIGGVLAFGAVLAGTLGFVLIPMTLLGILFAHGIGLLGTTPFLTSWCYGRRCIEAYKAGREQLPAKIAITAYAVGAGVAVGIPLAIAAILRMALR